VIAILYRCLAVAPARVDVLMLLVVMLSRLRRYREVVEVCQRVLQVDPEFFPAAETIRNVLKDRNAQDDLAELQIAPPPRLSDEYDWLVASNVTDALAEVMSRFYTELGVDSHTAPLMRGLDRFRRKLSDSKPEKAQSPVQSTLVLFETAWMQHRAGQTNKALRAFETIFHDVTVRQRASHNPFLKEAVVRSDDAKCIRRAHATSNLDLVGTNGLGGRIFDEIVSALGFGLEQQCSRRKLPHFAGQLEHVPSLAARELQFDLADWIGFPSCAHLPFVQRHLYAASVPANRHADAVNPRLEDRLQPPLELLGQQWRKGGAMGFAEVGGTAFDLMLPFPPPEGAIRSNGFDGLKKFVAIVPHAQRNAVPRQLLLRGIEVNRHQIFFLWWLSARTTHGFKFPKFARSHRELQLDLIAHLCCFV
jgi:hypothetical protein